MSHAVRYFKALSDDTRLRLVHVLSQYELSVNELVSLLETGQSRISRHLKILADAGLLVARRDGLRAYYSAVREGEGLEFLRAVAPFLTADMNMRADLDMAEGILEDRARKTRQFFNAVADHWDTLNREILGDFDLAGAVEAAVPKPCGVAVDLGCGTGLVLERLQGRAAQLIGVDGSSRMLELSRRRLGDEAGVSLRIGELDHLPLRDGEADFACINLVLHHLSDPASALREIFRVLRPGGTAFISDFDRHSQEKMRTDYGDRWLGFSREKLEEMILEAKLVPLSFTRQPVMRQLALNMALARRGAA
ncbi:MAG: metalloregulator ArsR/SmtB family transcription factor [Desulfovibrionaceae bacterium]|nr:metalloregulator ArsR/SmtB family transcription factor [Desulfovibrionaceae bacterium]